MLAVIDPDNNKDGHGILITYWFNIILKLSNTGVLLQSRGVLDPDVAEY